MQRPDEVSGTNKQGNLEESEHPSSIGVAWCVAMLTKGESSRLPARREILTSENHPPTMKQWSRLMADGAPNPHPIVVVIRALWQIFMGLFFLGVAFVFGMLVLDGQLWIIPIVALFGYFTYILLRNRPRRRSLTGQ